MKPKRVCIFGVGTAGVKIAGRLLELGSAFCSSPTVRVVLVDTDRIEPPGAIPGANATVIQCTPEGASPGSCGNDPALGERAAASVLERLDAALTESDLILVTGGLAGGAGAGISRVLARRVQEQHRTALFLMFYPFTFEGNWRRRRADESLNVLRELGVGVLPVPNDHLFQTVSPSTPADTAFAAAAEAAAGTLAGLVAAAVSEPLVPLELATIHAMIGEPPAFCGIGYGAGDGPDRWRTAVEKFFESPLLGGRNFLAEADGALMTVVGPLDMSAAEMHACTRALQEAFPPGADIVTGAFRAAVDTQELAVAGIAYKFRTTASRQVARDGTNRRTAFTAPPSRKPAGRRARKAAPETPTLQDELPLQPQTLGIFAGTEPTVIAGENLDVPTFQRRGIVVDRGD